MDTRVALFTKIGNGDIVDYIMLWLRNMQKTMAMIARRAFRGIFLGPVLVSRPLNIYGLERSRYPLHYFGADTEGGRTRIPSVNMMFHILNQMLGVTQTSTFPSLMTTPTFPGNWHTLDERKMWQSTPGVGRADRGRGPAGPGGLPDSRMWGSRDGVFTAIQNPRFFGPGF